MALETYKAKRDFNKTNEPKGVINKDHRNRFVVQRHAASHLHYDLRLEHKGVLKSWAIPKGPSMNPDDKRLAIHTEDHPVSYLFFEGTIPKGNYGAGIMSIWDAGTFTLYTDTPFEEQYEKGDLKLTLKGSKLKGQFALVKTNRGSKQNQWLLIKKNDPFATHLIYDAEAYRSPDQVKQAASKKRETTISRNTHIKPMLATTGSSIFNDPGYIFELKWDGYRLLSNINKGKVEIYSRNGIVYNTKFQEIAQELQEIPHDCILDGELVVVDANGKPDFSKLQNYTPHQTNGTLRYYVFDLLYLNGHATTSLTLLDRKSLLPDLLESLEHTYYCDHIDGMGITLYNKALDEGLEGVMAKQKESTYTPNYRTEQWLKIKHTHTDEFLICGFTITKKDSLFGSLLLGTLKEDTLTYVGNCGTGYSTKKQQEILDILKRFTVEESPFSEKINLKGRTPQWVAPTIYCEVSFTEYTKNGLLRHPVFKRLRLDKSEIEGITDGKGKNHFPNETNDQPAKQQKYVTATSNANTLEVNGISVPISNLEKIYWPKMGYTKYDLIDYYLQISETIIPYLKNRPQNLHRHPNGIKGESFYQKDTEHLPDWMETVHYHSKSANKDIAYLVCQNEATLLYMANLGCIELNPWHSQITTIDHPDYTILDLDPSPTNTFEEVIEVAQAVKTVLDSAKINGYVKTSGSKGLHIYVPLGKRHYTYSEARDFAKLLGYFVMERVPTLATMERTKTKRNGKIYIDCLQNRRGQTIASPYCVRPVPDACVSTPLLWDEVKPGLIMNAHTIKTLPERLQKMGDLFEPVLSEKIDMESAIDCLHS
ncbi:DNA ligase D [Marixanthomonas spongiae]|uniref:DNA ligase (ATP) n=1 Tax=Marixanthomonas spongiae TaxID=2174845 RepID=A0A2U0I572_9FLAO|nr:DNA ligase D [Marixanthomonas spongiae]PVW16258.1 DNA ligase D [Marixanthomonas spongiae]